jgi:eIF-2B alpha/beta/delta-like uncharacterized protein
MFWFPETRPYLQGARLTAWELDRGGIPLTLITDNMVGHFLKTGKVGAIVTGADRIAANGDTANKIGTYQMAVLAKENNVPFYIAAPVSTFDLSIPDGEHIPIEERSAAEVTHIQGVRIAPDVPAAHPAFDVTPNRYIRRHLYGARRRHRPLHRVSQEPRLCPGHRRRALIASRNHQIKKKREPDNRLPRKSLLWLKLEG